MSSKKIRITSEYAQILYEELKKEDFNTSIEHRDINEDIHKGVKKLWGLKIGLSLALR